MGPRVVSGHPNYWHLRWIRSVKPIFRNSRSRGGGAVVLEGMKRVVLRLFAADCLPGSVVAVGGF